MKPSDRDLWNLIGWLLVSLAFGLAVAGFVAALVVWPVLTGVASALAVTHLTAWWVPNRSLMAELEAARELHSATSTSEAREDLAEVGPVTPPRGVDEMDVPGFMTDSGYRPPLATGGLVAWSNPPVVVSEGSDGCVLSVPEPDHLGQACDWTLRDVGGPTCNQPAGEWVRWDNGHIEWLCTDHYTAVMGEPASLPARQRLD